MNGWGYSPLYHSLFESWRHDVKKVLEVGICGHRDIPNNRIGASLWVWHDYFPNAEIYGIDNDARWMVNDVPRIHTFCVDAYDSTALLKTMVEKIGVDQFDFICDDAIHDPLPQVQLLNDLWGFLRHGGVYAMEDVCPYKLPRHDLSGMIRFFPEDSNTTVHSTHKDERLLIIR